MKDPPMIILDVDSTVETGGDQAHQPPSLLVGRTVSFFAVNSVLFLHEGRWKSGWHQHRGRTRCTAVGDTAREWKAAAGGSEAALCHSRRTRGGQARDPALHPLVGVCCADCRLDQSVPEHVDPDSVGMCPPR